MTADIFFQVSYVVLWGLVILEGIGLFLIIRQFGAMYLTTREGVEGDGIAPGERAPKFTLPTPSGELVSLNSVLEQGKAALVLFGSPHCRFCHEVLPEFHRIATEYSREVVAIYVSQGTPAENHHVASEFGNPAVLLFTEDEKLAMNYKSRVTPFAFAVDNQGVVRAKGLANSYSQLRKMVEAALSSSIGVGGVQILDRPTALNPLTKEA